MVSMAFLNMLVNLSLNKSEKTFAIFFTIEFYFDKILVGKSILRW